MAIFAYGRVSTGSQTSLNQKLEIETNLGFPVDYWFEDHAVSGTVKAKDRPQFSEMILKLSKGDTVVFSKVDRVGRKASNVLQTVEELIERGITVYILQLGREPLNSPMGKVWLGMMSIFAEFDRDNIVSRVKAGIDRTKSQGTILGAPKMDSETASHIHNLISQGISQSKVAEMAGVSLSTVKRFNKHIVKTNSLTSFKERAKIQTLQHNKRKEGV